MSQELLNDNSIRLTEYNLIDFTFAVADLGAKGFVPTLLNGSHPEGGMGSWYTCVMVPRHQYRIDAQGNHINATKDDVEVAVESVEKMDTASVEQSSGVEQDVAETPPVVQTTRTRTKKST